MTHPSRSRLGLTALGLLATALLCVLPASASATSVSDAGEGFPLSMNASDHMLLAKFVIEEEEPGKPEENFEAPWTIWANGKSTKLEPLNGEGKGEAGEYPEHEMFLYNINSQGDVAGSSTVAYTEGSEERSILNPVWYGPEGQGHQVPLLQKEVDNKKGEPHRVGGVGTGIDDAGDVVGIDAVAGANGDVIGRGVFAPGGGNPVVVGEADKPSGEWFSEIYEVNAAGTMLGVIEQSVEKVNPQTEETESELVNPRYYLWKTPSEAGTLLNFEKPLDAFGLASDNSVLGYVSGKLVLRTPDGKETEVAGLDKPFAVNASHEVVGSEMVSGVEHAAVWQSGKVTDLNTLLPPGSGWVLTRASAINDGGDIAGVGSHEGKTQAFLLKPGLVVTSNADEKESGSAGKGVCATEKSGCTLRAAIETVNAAKEADTAHITFNVAGNKPAELSPAAALPALSSPADIEGSTQPGALSEGSGEEGRSIGVVIDGTKAQAANGLELGAGATGSIVSGVEIKKFGGAGVLLQGEGEQVADSILYSDHTGVEVQGANDTIGPVAGLAGNDFVEDGETSALAGYIRGIGSSKPALSAYDEAVAGYGAGVLLAKGGASGTQIQGNLIGLAGGLRSLVTTNGISTFGVLIDPAEATIANVSIGASAKNLISGDFTGVALLGSRGGSISGVSILGNQIGGDRGYSGEPELGTILGLMAEGKTSGLQVGSSAQGNTFPADLIGMLLSGSELTGASIQGNTMGVDKGLSSFSGGALEGHDIIAIIAADTVGAQIGGASGQGNKILGAPLGIILAGEHSAENRLESNTIGRNAPPPGPFDLSEKSFDTDQFGGIIGLLDFSGSEQQIGSAGAGNAIQGNLFGMLSFEEKDDTIQGNAFVKNGFALFDLGSGGTLFGGNSPGQGNQVASDALGGFFANIEPTKQELEEAQASPRAASAEVRKATLHETPNEAEALDDVNGTSEADLTEAALEALTAPSKPGTNNHIEGNVFGSNASGETKNGSGETLGNTVALLIGGDEHQLTVGGTVAGEGNQVVNSGSGGVLIAGTAAHPPSVQVLGNVIYNNSTFGGLIQGLPGLGINLIGEEGSAFGVLGVDPQDPTQPDTGPNGLQNAPILSSATTSAGQLTVSGTLQSAANASYTIELFADEFKNPYGAGEGQQILGRLNLQTDASGHASFTATVPAPGTNSQYVSATATTLPAAGAIGATSEFALDAMIEAGAAASTTAPTGTAAPATTSTTTATTPAPTVPTTAIVEHSGTLTATVSAVKFTLPGVTVDCASAAASGCSASATATETGAGSKASAAATRGKKKPVVLARWSAKLAAGSGSKVTLTLTGQGKALLARKHSLLLSVTLSVKAGTAHAVTRTLRVHLVEPKKGKARRKG